MCVCVCVCVCVYLSVRKCGMQIHLKQVKTRALVCVSMHLAVGCVYLCVHTHKCGNQTYLKQGEARALACKHVPGHADILDIIQEKKVKIEQ